MGRLSTMARRMMPKLVWSCGVLVQVVEHHLGDLSPFELDHDAHPAPIGFVADVRDAVHFLVPRELGDFLDQPGLVHLVGNLGHHDGFPVLPRLFDLRAGPHLDAAPAGAIRLLDAWSAVDEGRGRESPVRARFREARPRARYRSPLWTQVRGGCRRPPRANCGAGCWSPCRPRSRSPRSRGGWGRPRAERLAPACCRRSSGRSRPFPCRCPASCFRRGR